MLDDDQPDRTESGTPAPEAATEAAPPVVTRRTRKASAKKAAAAPAAGTDAPAASSPGATSDATSDATPDAASDGAPGATSEGATEGDDAPVVRKTASRRAPAKKAPARRSTAKKAAPAPEPDPSAEPEPARADAAADEASEASEAPAPAKRAARKSAAKAPAKKTAAKRTSAKKAAAVPADEAAPSVEAPAVGTGDAETGDSPDAAAEAPTDTGAGRAVLFQPPVVTTTTRRTRKKSATAPAEPSEAGGTAEHSEVTAEQAGADEQAGPAPAKGRKSTAKKSATKKSTDAQSGPRSGRKAAAKASAESAGDVPIAADEDEDEDAAGAALGDEADTTATEETAATLASTDGDDSSSDSSDGSDTSDGSDDSDDSDGEGGSGRRRRRRGGRRRRKSGEGNGEGNGDGGGDAGEPGSPDTSEGADDSGSSTGPADGDSEAGDSGEGSSRRRRRRRRSGEEGSSDDAEPHTVTRVRKGRSAEDQITAVSGSTRLEAKKQRRREGREAGRRRAPIVSEAEFLARRESVERVMVVRQREDLTQIAVLEDKVLVEHYVARKSQTSLIGNVYLGRVQNVLPSMEAAFIDIGKGRNAVIYAGEVNWQALGHKDGQQRKIESVLSSGQMVLVQVTKDPVGHKGARLTSQVSLAGRFLVYVPDGTTSGISRKLPDTERGRLKTLLKEIVPDTAGVIVRTAAEGASEDELTRDVERLKARWEAIEKKATHKGSGPQLLYGEPDLTLKVVRDLFTEDFSKLVIEGDDAWDTVHDYVESVAPDLAERLERFERGATGGDVFATYRIDEQIKKGLDRKVWLPSGGSLVIDRTEAMTVVDVNTGKFTGSGGNLEAAEEIVRQLRLRDIGGIIVVDFIDMVLESNRDLVVRRLVECLGRDRTRHQVAEVTSLGLVQMTRKRIGTGLLESFSENCEHCHGRGVVIKDQPVDPDARPDDGEGRRGGRRRGRRGAGNDDAGNGIGDARAAEAHHAPSPKDVAAMARQERAAEEPADEPSDEPSGSGRTSESADEKADERVDEKADERVDQVDEAPPMDDESSDGGRTTEPADEAVVEAPPVEEVDAAPPVEADKPRVVTRTRRRAASRPAGPPSGVGTVPTTGGPAADPVAAPVDGHVEASGGGPGEPPVVEHVPIKKKGSRKR